MTAVRICLCGDEATGKSSLVVAFARDTYHSQKIIPVLPAVTVPPLPGIQDNVSITIVDTSARLQDRDTLRKEIRKSNVILLVFSDHYSYDRVALFWMPYFRSLGVNVPVILCYMKSDLRGDDSHVVEEEKKEMAPVMSEFREIDSYIRASAKQRQNVIEVFNICRRAVVCPIAPLYDLKEGKLKPACVAALKRIFYLCDKDQDGHLNDEELQGFQIRTFGELTDQKNLDEIKLAVSQVTPGTSMERGLDLDGFVQLNKLWAEMGRQETIWCLLRQHHYTDSLSLEDGFLHPNLEVPEYASAELSPAGYAFLMDLFRLFDKDNDGGLNDQELAALFAPMPGLPASWMETSFPSSTVRNEAGHITLQGWLAQWSMTTFLEPRTTLECLAYLGFEPHNPRDPNTTALKITKPRKRRRRIGGVDRNVVHCYVVGAAEAGKSSLLNAFLSRPFDSLHHPTIKPRRAVHPVELPGGKQCYLILEELGELEPVILENQAKLDTCDLICYAFDSSDPDSFSHIVDLRRKYPQLDELPSLYTGLKADKDKTTQRSELQPDTYTTSLHMNPPMHVSVKWESINELFVALAEAATNPSLAFPKSDEDQFQDRTAWYVAAGATVAAGVAAFWIWRRSSSSG